MCLHRIEVFNKFIGRSLTVDCGHCVDCQVSKANQQCTRIINDWEKDYFYYFVTLTYDNPHVPYVLHQCLVHDDSIINIYRGSFELVGSVSYSSKEEFNQVTQSLDSVPFLRNHFVFGAVGVLFHADATNFLKRLRKYTNKHYGNTFTYYLVSEYGETFYRPHFHLLFKTKISEKEFYNSVTTCWSMCDWTKVPRGFEPAISPYSYLSLYLTSNIDLPFLYQLGDFRPKKSHSLYFGSSSKLFSLDNIFHSAEKHDLTYYKPPSSPTSSLPGSFVPYPSYVVHRYFPKFKGIGKLLHDDFIFFAKSVSDAIKGHSVFEYPAPITEKEYLTRPFIACSQGLRYFSLLKRLRLFPSDIRDIVRKVNRCYEFSKLLGVDFDYYLDIWYSVSVILFSQRMREMLTSETNFSNYYFNIDDYMNNKIRAPTLDPIFEELVSLDYVSSISSNDVLKHHSSLRKHYKYNKNKKIKYHLL